MTADGSFGAAYQGAWAMDVELDDHGYGNPTFLYSYYYTVTSTQDGVVYTGPVVFDEVDTSPPPPPTQIPPFSPTGWAEGYLQTSNGAVSKVGLDSSNEAGFDTLELGKDITFADLDFAMNGNDLTIIFDGDSASQITINNQNTVGGRIETLQFHDGLSASLSGLVVAESDSTANGIAGEEAFLVGADGNETLTGADSDDVIFGGAGNDTIDGGDGDDIIEGGAGADILSGGSNSSAEDTPNWGDTVSYRSANTIIRVDFRVTTGQDQTNTASDAYNDILTGFENFEGSLTKRDFFDGDDNDNRAFGFGGSDFLRGYGGDDVLVGGEGSDFLYGYDDEDNLVGESGNDYLNGGNDNDILTGGTGKDRLVGGNGDDTLIGGAGNDATIAGESGYGYLLGGNGNDLIDGGEGNDDLQGQAGNDRLIGGAGDDLLDGGTGDDLFLLGANDGEDSITDTAGTNIIAFDPEVSRGDLWLTQVGDDLRIGVIGGDTVATVSNFYAVSGATLVDRIQTTDGQLLLNHSDVQAMVTRMTAEAASATPDELPTDLAADLDLYWDDAQGVAPRAPQDPQTVLIDNYGANAINLDDWPGTARTSKGQNLVSGDGWPRDVDAVPAGAANVAGWRNIASRIEETRWAQVNGPYGSDIIALQSAQNDSDATGGGNETNQFDIDGSKTYEFTYYFKADALNKNRIYFGPGYDGSLVLDAETGNSVSNPYFTYDYANEASGIEAGKWYKLVGYVLGEGETATQGTYGGVYDTETGEKVRDIRTFSWNANRNNNFTRSRVHTNYGAADPEYYTSFYQPEVREIDTSAILVDGEKLDIYHDSRFVGDTNIEGWFNHVAYARDGEARWKETDGPDGNPAVVLETGQFDGATVGGGNFTNRIGVASDI